MKTKESYMEKSRKPRKKWLVCLDYVLLPASSFFAIFYYIEGDLVLSIIMLSLVFMSIGRLIKDRKTKA